jgi:hypothetical protein
VPGIFYCVSLFFIIEGASKKWKSSVKDKGKIRLYAIDLSMAKTIFCIAIFCRNEKNIPSKQTFARCSRKLVSSIRICRSYPKEQK